MSDELYRLLVGGTKPVLIERQQSADDERFVGGHHLVVDLNVGC